MGECRDGDIPLSHVELDPALWGFLRAKHDQLAVRLVSDPELVGEARFYRYNARAVGGEGGAP